MRQAVYRSMVQPEQAAQPLHERDRWHSANAKHGCSGSCQSLHARHGLMASFSFPKFLLAYLAYSFSDLCCIRFRCIAQVHRSVKCSTISRGVKVWQAMWTLLPFHHCQECLWKCFCIRLEMLNEVDNCFRFRLAIHSAYSSKLWCFA